MARVSFGSRAGSTSDYLSGGTPLNLRQPNINGVYGSLQELTDALRTEIAACAQSEIPDLTTCELSIREDAIIPLLRPVIGPYADGGDHDLPPEYKQAWTDGSEQYPGLSAALPKASVTFVLAAGEGQSRQIVQRAASRAIVQALEATDGFKYSFNNAWAAKDEGGLRFSYICQDSMQNKDRHANGFTKTQKHLKGEGERGPRKPTYDCKGSVSVKFSAVRRRVDVYYRHYAIHSSVAERKPASRPAAKPKAPKPMVERPVVPGVAPPEPDTGGLLGTLQSQTTAYGLPDDFQQPARPGSSNVDRPRKRKRDSDAQMPRDSNKPLSLVELLQQSEDAKKPAPAEKDLRKVTNTVVPPPIEYNLPFWQAPPPKLPAPPQQYQPSTSSQQPTQDSGYRAPYPPPYQPQHSQQATSYTPNRTMPIPKNPHTTTSQQEFLGVPKGRHPQGQGLFSTLKPVRKEDYTTYEPHFIVYQSHRAKTSCQNCRLSKKKCDEGRPLCGACARAGKIECVYEGAPSRAPNYGTQDTSNVSQTSAPSQSVSHNVPSYSQMPQTAHSAQSYQTAASSQTFAAPQSQPMPAPGREGSPDPWFPQR